MDIRKLLATPMVALGIPAAVFGGVYATAEAVAVFEAGSAQAGDCNLPVTGPLGRSIQACWNTMPDGSVQWCNYFTGPVLSFPLNCWPG